MAHHFLYMYTLCVMVLTLMSVTEADQSFNPPVHRYEAGRMSYFDQWNNVIETVNHAHYLKNNQSYREHFDDVLKDVNKFGNFMNMKHLSLIDSQYQNLLSSDLSEKIDKVLDVIRSNPLLSQSQCVNDTGRMIIDLFKKNKTSSWAIEMLDSIGKPGPSITKGRLTWVGNYKQCRAAHAPPDEESYSQGFSGEYVLLSLKTAVIPSFIWGTCFPDTCKDYEIYFLLNDTITALGMSKETEIIYPTIVNNDDRPFTAASYVSVVIICIIGTLMILGTAYDIIVIQKPRWSIDMSTQNVDETTEIPQNHNKTEASSSNGQNGTSIVVDDRKPILEPSTKGDDASTVSKVLLAFSVYTNATKFFNTKQTPGSLSAIHGIRFLSMSWVILGHTYFFGAQEFINKDEQPTLLKTWTFAAVSNALPSVDTFFTLSGLLTSYLAVKEIKKKGLKINWGLFYFHRFWRLTPPYMLTLLLVLGLQRFLGSGAEWGNSDLQPYDKKNCEDNWWTNLLYINNVVHTDKVCFGHAWYLANDMQFFVLSPLMLIPFYFHTYAGLASCSLFLLVNWVTTGTLSSINKWPATAFAIGADPMAGLSWANDYYGKPWCRIGPYVVGLAVGALLATKQIRLNRITSLIGWITATASGLAVVYGVQGDISGENLSSVGAAALYNAVGRSVWGACVCWVIVSCVYGYGGFVNSILSWSPFVSLGRLTYMAYLIHPCILTVYYTNMDQLFYVNNFNIIITYCGILLFTNMVAFVLMLGLESPMIGLEKALLPRRKV